MRPRSLAAILLVVAAVAGGWYWLSRPSVPAQGSPAYEDVSRAFYRGLAALEVGLLDDARKNFTRATEIVPTEPASWANLGIAQLRLGELDAAAAPLEKALSLAPRNSDLALIAGRMEIARGRLDEGIAALRRAVDLDPQALRARFALSEELERLGTPESDGEAQRQLDELQQLAPDNLAILLERLRVAAKRGDTDRVRDSMTRLAGFAASWQPAVVEQYDGLRRAVDGNQMAAAARQAQLLRNVLSRVPAFTESLGAVRTPAELIAEPFDRFLVLGTPMSTPAAADASVTFAAEPLGSGDAGSFTSVIAFAADTSGQSMTVGISGTAARRLDASGPEWPVRTSSVAGVLPLDWNHDFRTDLVLAGGDGLRLLVQDESGGFMDVTAQAAGESPLACDCFGAWAADIEMDGDLDVIVGMTDGATVVLRNNGDGTWRTLSTFSSVTNARGFGWADLDGDADPDAVFMDAAGALHVLLNRQAGDFTRVAPPDIPNAAALTIADANADGTLDLIVLDAAGAVRRASRAGDSWVLANLATWPAFPAAATSGSYRLFAADLDNNGALDLVAAGAGATRVWLASEALEFQPLASAPSGEMFSLADANGDGRLDATAVSGGRPVRLVGRGQQNYHWKTVRARAQQNAGDQRINSFGIGGEIEVRSGLLVQKQVLTGGPVHIGLGNRTAIDVARIVWPNGVAQAEFDAKIDDDMVAEQRLKGSCPWVFAYNGREIGFVTDFLWRSPLGLRINAQDTAGTTQTEDWIRIRGDQLVPRDGVYDVRITAELWETHFFDHVSLMAVDHPGGTEVFVDERFSATRQPVLAVQAVTERGAVANARDQDGRDVSAVVARDDGQYLATFKRGVYQGIAADHVVEFDGRDFAAGEQPVLVARGWVYPTDSSINVAIAQGRHDPPRGIALEAQDKSGAWTVVEPDLGFPAGKNKTMVIDLDRARGARRLRLRSNLEVYWDSLIYGVRSTAPVRSQRLPAAAAELRYRGFSQTLSPRGDSPEIPDYQRLANSTPRWRDLTGYYTRFGEVGELLASVDDRYVIMNAGDEMRLTFKALPAVADGWRRDFVLIGDGWEKDGDYNTGFSDTVLPLPTHAKGHYEAEGASLELEDDPVYKAHRQDWEQYHTRFVTPRAFLRGLRNR